MLLPRYVVMPLYQKLKHGHEHDAENEEQGEFPAMLTSEYGQTVMVHVVTQQDVPIIVGERTKHVIMVMRCLDEHAMLIWDE